MTRIPCPAHLARAACLALVPAGCVNMSGLEGESRYACAAPDGVACDSVAGTYANALRHKLPSQQEPAAAPARAASAASAGATVSPIASTSAVRAHGGDGRWTSTQESSEAVASTGMALRSPARVLRLWTKPWEDADGDLWDQGFVYVQVHGGRWQLEHVQQRIRDRYTPLQPPPGAASSSTASSTGNSPEAPPYSEGASPGAQAAPFFGNFPSFNRPETVPGQRQP